MFPGSEPRGGSVLAHQPAGPPKARLLFAPLFIWKQRQSSSLADVSFLPCPAFPTRTLAGASDHVTGQRRDENFARFHRRDADRRTASRTWKQKLCKTQRARCQRCHEEAHAVLFSGPTWQLENKAWTNKQRATIDALPCSGNGLRRELLLWSSPEESVPQSTESCFKSPMWGSSVRTDTKRNPSR